MRIGLFLPHVSVFGGVRRYLELGNEWTALGHDVTLFHPEGGRGGGGGRRWRRGGGRSGRAGGRAAAGASAGGGGRRGRGWVPSGGSASGRAPEFETVLFDALDPSTNPRDPREGAALPPNAR